MHARFPLAGRRARDSNAATNIRHITILERTEGRRPFDLTRPSEAPAVPGPEGEAPAVPGPGPEGEGAAPGPEGEGAAPD